jgi:hypothetical protein
MSCLHSFVRYTSTDSVSKAERDQYWLQGSLINNDRISARSECLKRGVNMDPQHKLSLKVAMIFVLVCIILRVHGWLACFLVLVGPRNNYLCFCPLLVHCCLLHLDRREFLWILRLWSDLSRSTVDKYIAGMGGYAYDHWERATLGNRLPSLQDVEEPV